MPKIDPYKYLSSGRAYNEMRELRPGLAGVYHENGNVYASDAHILVRLKQDYPKNLEKKLIGKDGKEVPEMMNGKPTGKKAKPAGFDRVIPSVKTINEDYAVYAIDPGKLKEKLKGKKVQDDLFVSFVDKDSGKFVSKFNAGYLLKVADFMIKTKHPFALLHFSNSTRPMLVNTEGALLMLMPVSNYNPEQEYAEMKIERILNPQKASTKPTKIEKVRQPATPKPKSKPKNAMKPIKIKGRGKLGELVEKVTEKYNELFHKADASIITHIEHVAKSGEAKDLYKRIAWDVARAAKYQNWDFLPKDRQGFITATDSELSTLFVQAIKKSDIDKYIKRELKTKKPTTMTKKRTTAKAHGSSTTMRDASRILKAQKDDYQKIFRAEVKKSKDPKAGAKKAGKIYRDRYGATATARWKKALKRAK